MCSRSVATFVAVVAAVAGTIAVAWVAGPDTPAQQQGTAGPAQTDAGVVAYLIRSTGNDLLLYEDLVAVRVHGRGSDAVARVEEALHAAADGGRREEGNDVAPLAPAAVPRVSRNHDVMVLDWDSDRASLELSRWGTSSGNTGLNPIAGMVFENAPEIMWLEHRVDGSCVEFTSRMQGAGCHRDSRQRWIAYTSS